MRIVSVLAGAALMFVLSAPPAHAAMSADPMMDAQGMQMLEQKVQTADAREKCFLYTELARGYAEIAGHQIAAGEMDEASLTIKRVEQYAALVHQGLTAQPNKHKRVKDAEMMMQETSYKVGQFLHAVGSEDKASVLAALKQVNKANEDLLAQVFAH